MGLFKKRYFHFLLIFSILILIGGFAFLNKVYGQQTPQGEVLSHQGTPHWTFERDSVDIDKLKIYFNQDKALPPLTVNTAGQIGLGTTSPQGRLSVAGEGADPRDRLTIYQPGDNVLAIQTLLDDQALSGYNYGGDQNKLILQPLIGNVGIGNNLPNRALDVSTRSIDGRDGIAIGEQSDNKQAIQTYIDGHWADRTTYAGGCCNTLLIQPDVGVVGIGTSAPGAKLDVVAPGSIAVHGVGSIGVEGVVATSGWGVHGAGGVNGIGVYGSGGTYGVYADSYNGIQGNGSNVGVVGNNISSGCVGYIGYSTYSFFAANCGTNIGSSKTIKENFETISDTQTLENIESLPVMKWNYKANDPSEKHIGPFAEDFYNAFGLGGTDNKSISVGDEGGVALVGIKELSKRQKLLEQKNYELEQKIKVLEEKLDKLSK